MSVGLKRPGIGRVIPALFLLFFLCPVSAQAQTYWYSHGSDYSEWYGTPEAACFAWLDSLNRTNAWGKAVFTVRDQYPNCYDPQTGYYLGAAHCGPSSNPVCQYVAVYSPTKTTEAPAGCNYLHPITQVCTDTDPEAECAGLAGTSVSKTGSGGWAGKPQSFVDSNNGCNLSEAGGVSLLLGDNDTWNGNYVYDGTLGTPGGSVPTDTTKTQQGGSTTCSTSSAGNTLCIDELNPNCMSFNGEQICGSTSTGTSSPKLPSDGTCRTYTTGDVCESTAINTPVDGYGNPVPSDSTQVGAESGSGGTVYYDYYPNGDGDPSTQAGEQGASGTGGTSGTGSTTIEGEVEVGCDGCPAWSDGGAAAGGNASQTAIEQGMDDDMGLGQTGITPQSAMPAAATCQQLSYTWNGYDFTWPSSDGCTKINSVKELIGWFFYAMTAIYLFLLATRKPG